MPFLSLLFSNMFCFIFVRVECKMFILCLFSMECSVDSFLSCTGIVLEPHTKGGKKNCRTISIYGTKYLLCAAYGLFRRYWVVRFFVFIQLLLLMQEIACIIKKSGTKTKRRKKAVLFNCTYLYLKTQEIKWFPSHAFYSIFSASDIRFASAFHVK